MKKTKERIQEAAVRLFNERGYSKVSLRDIAAEAGTTIGNLTYHFPQKEDLLIKMLEDLHTGFFGHISSGIHRAELLSQLLNSFTAVQKNEEEQPFYYKNIYELTACSGILAEKSKAFQHQLYGYYVSCFQTLRNDQVFRADLDDDTLEALAYSIITLTIVWLQDNSPYYNDKLPTLPISYVLGKLVSPYITAEYTVEYQSLCREKGLIV